MEPNLKQATENLENYLKENPKMQPFQNEVKRILENIPTQEGRVEALSIMIQERLQTLQEKLCELNNLLKGDENAKQ